MIFIGVSHMETSAIIRDLVMFSIGALSILFVDELLNIRHEDKEEDDNDEDAYKKYLSDD